MKASLNLSELGSIVGDLVVKKTPVFGLRFLTSIVKLPDHSHSLIQWIWSPLDWLELQRTLSPLIMG